MPLETATYLNQLDATNPAHDDSLGFTDAQIRLLKQVLQATFPALTGPVTATQAQLNAITTAPARLTALEAASNHLTGAQTLTGSLGVSGVVNAGTIQENGNQLLPYGMIVMWSGATTAVPAGWHLCDGTAGTPNLRDRFVIGAGSSYGPWAAGGNASLTNVPTNVAGAHSHDGLTTAAGSHTHSAWTDVQGGHDHAGSTVGHALTLEEIPPHAHNYTVLTGGVNTGGLGGLIGGVSASNGANATSYSGNGWEHLHAIRWAGDHSHNVGIGAVGDHQHGIDWDGGHQHVWSADIRPPYFALCFIMKIT